MNLQYISQTKKHPDVWHNPKPLLYFISFIDLISNCDINTLIAMKHIASCVTFYQNRQKYMKTFWWRRWKHPTKSPSFSRHSTPGETTWRWESRSTLVQVMACRLTAPDHYLNQSWLTSSDILWHSFHCKVYLDTQDMNQSSRCVEIHAFKITAICDNDLMHVMRRQLQFYLVLLLFLTQTTSPTLIVCKGKYCGNIIGHIYPLWPNYSILRDRSKC